VWGREQQVSDQADTTTEYWRHYQAEHGKEKLRKATATLEFMP
jgi:hypothetical protein